MEGWVGVVEAPDTLLQVEVEGVFWDAIETSEMSFSLVPEVLDAIDVIDLLGEVFGVIDALMMKAFNVQSVVADEAIGINHAVGLHVRLDDREQRRFASIWDHLSVDLSTAFEDAEHWHFATCTATPFAFPLPTKVTLVQLNRTTQNLCTTLILNDNLLSQATVEVGCCIAMNTHQNRCHPSRRSRHKMLYQPALNINI